MDSSVAYVHGQAAFLAPQPVISQLCCPRTVRAQTVLLAFTRHPCMFSGENMQCTQHSIRQSRSGGRQFMFDPLPVHLSTLCPALRTRAKLIPQVLSGLFVVSSLSLLPPSTENFLYISPLLTHAYPGLMTALDLIEILLQVLPTLTSHFKTSEK